MNDKISNFIEASLNSAKKLSQLINGIFSGFRNKKLTVQTEIKGVEEVERTKKKLDSLPKTKTVEMKVEKSGDFSVLEMTGKNLDKSLSVKSEVSGLDQVRQLNQDINNMPKAITVAPPPVSQWTRMKGVFADVRAGINDISAGMKNLAADFMSKGGGALILYEGIKSLINIGKHFYGEWINGMKESAEVSERNAESIREAAQANEELRQKGDAYLAQLEKFSSQESLSNANKAEAAKIIGKLTKAYGELGIKLDETTGKLTGVDSAMIKKGEKDKARRIKELEAELKEIENENAQQAELRDKAGIPVWFGGNTRLGGKETIEAATKKIEENNKRAGEIRRRLHEERKKDPAGEIRSKRAAEVADLEAQNRERQRAFERKKADDEFASESDPAKKIENRRKLQEQHKKEKLDPLEAKVQAAREAVRNKSGDDQVEAKRNLLQLEKELQAEREKAYALEQQIAGVKKQQADAAAQLDKQGKAGKSEKAAAVNSEMREKAQKLKDRAMEMSGRGQESAREQAVREAERRSGGKLSEEERAKVEKLSDLSWEMDHRAEPSMGDLSIQSNDLTSRGGFSGGAVKPDSEKIAQETCNYNKRQAETAEKIMRFLEELGRN